MFISIDYTRIFTIIYDYVRLFAIILLHWQKPKRLYAITSISKDDYFTHCTTIISLFFSVYIIVIIAIMHDYVHYLFRKLLLFYFKLR